MKKLILDTTVNTLDLVTPKKLNKEKIKETINMFTTSRTMVYNLGLLITGLVGAITPYIQSHVSSSTFSILTAISGIIGMYYRATTVTPKGKLGLDE